MKNDDNKPENASSSTINLEETWSSSYQNELRNRALVNTMELESARIVRTGVLGEAFYDCTSRPDQEPCCHVKMDTIHKMKDSTKKLLHILDQIQAKTRKKFSICEDVTVNGVLQTMTPSISQSNLNLSDMIPNEALIRLELQTRVMQNINVESEEDDCSVYKKLARKCHCLNNKDYNDFVIHFNENTKYTTNSIGEIVKNMRILKKFLYMGGEYTKHALMFLNDGLTHSKLPERIEIIHGCSHADVCNVFEEHSLVTVCISWPCKAEFYGCTTSQVWAAQLLLKLADLEDGRRYLNFNSKITNDIRKILRKRATQLDIVIIETLNEVLNLLRPVFAKNPNVSYICKTANEGIGSRTIKDLVESREYMTLNEIFMHLDLLRNFSKIDFGKDELTLNLPALLLLFRDLLREYDNSEMNILIMNMLTNLMARHIRKPEQGKISSAKAIADAATEPIRKKNEGIQMPPKKNIKKHKNMKGLGVSPVKLMNQSKRRISDWDPSNNFLNRSKKFTKDMRSSIIIVPLEKKFTV
ncbi:unnamed protein product [Leptosia nina]|uniref:Uncharacterized protein n=1 Tax=Leptosia nina TaxID=320188 RepID=A0AAV1K0R0_9NEOP